MLLETHLLLFLFMLLTPCVLRVLQRAEQESGSPNRGPDVLRSPRASVPEDAEKQAQPPDGWGLLGPQHHGDPVSKL